MTTSKEQLEEFLKLMVKYQVQEISLPDGIKIVKTVHIPQVKQTRRKRSQSQQDVVLPSQDNTIPESVLYVASGKPKQNGYSDMKVSSVLPNILKQE